MPPRRIAAVTCVLALALSAVGCSASGPRATNGAGYVEGDSVNVIAAADREQAPDLAGPLVGGGIGELRHDLGKVIVLNVWASWCTPCRAESPALVAAAKALPRAIFMGINIRDNESDAESFVRTHGIPYPSFFDQAGDLRLQLQRVVPVSSQPETIILDKLGRVAAAIYGPTTAITLKDIVRPLERER